MKKILKKTALPVLLCTALMLAGCQTKTAGTATSASSTTEAVTDTAAAVSTIDTSALFSDRDLDASYDESTAVTIQLSGDTASCSSDAVTIDGSQITLLDEGTYVFSGTLTNGQIVIDADDTDQVQIVLSGADITSSTSAAIYSLEADKVFVTLAEGTENFLANGGAFVAIDDNNIDAVVFSKTDLTLNGSGSLKVNSPVGHGLVSKDELTVTGGSYTITAANHGFTGKDSVAISDGSFTITSGKDGIHAENTDDAAMGFLYLADGDFTIDTQGDAISASGALQIDDGAYILTSGGGSSTVTMTADGMQWQQPGQQTQNTTAERSTSDETVSCKGLKADGTLTVNGGDFTLDTADDAVHAGGNVTITGGTWTIRTGDDGIHSDAAAVIQAGTISIPYCYEGVEGQSVTIEGETLDITAYDDGINSAGGADGSGTDMGFGGMDQFASDENCFVIINGGVITIVSDGDSIDSNGDLTVNGGTLDLTCNGNGNTAIDTNGTYTDNGGSVTTNDGSESGTGGMGGGPGGQAGKSGKRAGETLDGQGS
jgi:lipopolysaccharide export system protein LptA